ncbi:MAG: 4-(cytidine 5'-diphospho)-2-C-methyl-D-erythritol kinase, partial [Acetobacteraceae bacterium]
MNRAPGPVRAARPASVVGPDVAEEIAPAKVNLYLHVLGRRADGYHLLDSLVVFAGAADRVHAAPAADLSLALAGPFGAALQAEPDNLVLRAGRELAAAACVVPAGRLTLEKALPVASGIGGGSADAAAALRLLTRWWGIAPGAVDLAAIAGRLGADVPVCLIGRPARMGGAGEALGPAPRLPRSGLVLVNPGVELATAAVFRARTGPFSAPAVLAESWADARAMAADLALLRNDLEPSARALCPPID